MSLILRYYNLNRLQLFIGITLINLLIIWLSKSVLINELVFYNTFSEQLTLDRSNELFENLRRLAWVSYVFTPIMLLIKFTLVSLVLYIGIVFINIQDRISLGSIFKVVIASEIVFVLANIIKFLWFYLFAGNYDLNDIGFFYPLSLANFFKTGEIDRLWIFPMQTANLFQLIYIVLVAFALNKVCEIKMADSEKVVLFTYIPALVIWVSLIMFLTIDTAI